MAEVSSVIDLFALAEIFIGITIIAGGWLYILSWFYEAKRMMRWRSYAFTITLGFTLSMFFNAMGMITIVNGLTELTNWLFNLTIFSLLLTFAGIGLVAKDIASLEKLGVGLRRLEKVKFTMTPHRQEVDGTGIPCVDELLIGKMKRTPFAIYGAEGSHPWRLGQRFICDGLIKGDPCIYFAITRPPELIIEQLTHLMKKYHKKDFEKFKNDFAIVDCFTPFAGLNEHETFFMADDYKSQGWKYVAADPRDLNAVHSAYRDARKMLGARDNMRVVYDEFSGISELAEEQLLYQYLLHTITSEDKFGYMTLYIIKRPEDLKYVNRLASGLVKIDAVSGDRFIEIEKMPTKFRPGRFKLNDDDKIVGRLRT